MASFEELTQTPLSHQEKSSSTRRGKTPVTAASALACRQSRHISQVLEAWQMALGTHHRHTKANAMNRAVRMGILTSMTPAIPIALPPSAGPEATVPGALHRSFPFPGTRLSNPRSQRATHQTPVGCARKWADNVILNNVIGRSMVGSVGCGRSPEKESVERAAAPHGPGRWNGDLTALQGCVHLIVGQRQDLGC